MRKFTLILATLILSFSALAQVSDEARISVSPVMPEYGNIPAAAQNTLYSKLQRVITTNGLAESSGERFVLTPRVDIVESGVTSAGMMLLKIEVTFIFGDVIEDKIYGTATVNATGIGDSEEKCYVKAFQVLKPNHPTLMAMLNKAKADIITYYNDNYDFIVKDIDRMAAMGQYQEALAKALTVPQVCKNVYMLCQDKALEIYGMQTEALRKEMDKQNQIILQQARSAWAVKNDYESAQNALSLLAQIDPDASCRADADALLKEIDNNLRAQEKARAEAEAAKARAEWEFKMRKYEDDLAMAQQKQADKAAILGALVNRFGRIDLGIQKEKTSRWGFAK